MGLVFSADGFAHTLTGDTNSSEDGHVGGFCFLVQPWEQMIARSSDSKSVASGPPNGLLLIIKPDSCNLCAYFVTLATANTHLLQSAERYCACILREGRIPQFCTVSTLSSPFSPSSSLSLFSSPFSSPCVPSSSLPLCLSPPHPPHPLNPLSLAFSLSLSLSLFLFLFLSHSLLPLSLSLSRAVEIQVQMLVCFYHKQM